MCHSASCKMLRNQPLWCSICSVILRWDVEKVAESSNFVALTKPAGMFVVTDERGLWEESSTNFIHVAHRRCRCADKSMRNLTDKCNQDQSSILTWSILTSKSTSLPISYYYLDQDPTRYLNIWAELNHVEFSWMTALRLSDSTQGGNAHTFWTTATWDLSSFGLAHQRCADIWEVLVCVQALRWPKQLLVLKVV